MFWITFFFVPRETKHLFRAILNSLPSDWPVHVQSLMFLSPFVYLLVLDLFLVTSALSSTSTPHSQVTWHSLNKCFLVVLYLIHNSRVLTFWQFMEDQHTHSINTNDLVFLWCETGHVHTSNLWEWRPWVTKQKEKTDYRKNSCH